MKRKENKKNFKKLMILKENRKRTSLKKTKAQKEDLLFMMISKMKILKILHLIDEDEDDTKRLIYKKIRIYILLNLPHSLNCGFICFAQKKLPFQDNDILHVQFFQESRSRLFRFQTFDVVLHRTRYIQFWPFCFL